MQPINKTTKAIQFRTRLWLLTPTLTLIRGDRLELLNSISDYFSSLKILLSNNFLWAHQKGYLPTQSRLQISKIGPVRLVFKNWQFWAKIANIHLIKWNRSMFFLQIKIRVPSFEGGREDWKVGTISLVWTIFNFESFPKEQKI